MSLFFHKKAILASAEAVKGLFDKYKAYTQKIVYPDDDKKRQEECTANSVLLSSCLSQVKLASETMQSKIDKMEEFYHSTKSKSEQKEMLADIEEFDKESQYSESVEKKRHHLLATLNRG